MSFIKNPRVLAVVSLVLRIVLGGIFLTSGIQKLGNLDLFYQTAQGYKILTPELIQVYAGALPWLEILGGLTLLLGIFTRYAAYLLSLLLISFLIALGIVLVRGDAIECGCFLGGGPSSPVTWDLWFRDLLMLAGTLIVAFINSKSWTLDAVMEKRPTLKTVVIAVVSIFALGTAVAAIVSEVPKPPPTPPTPPPPLQAGSMAPDFSLRDLEGKTVTLQEFHGKKNVLLEVFASWCPHCQHSVPALKQLQQAYPDQLQILAINAGDQPGTPSTGKAFQQQYQITYPILEKPSMELMNAYHVSGFPTIYLIDRSGKIVWNHVGTLDEPSASQIKANLH